MHTYRTAQTNECLTVKMGKKISKTEHSEALAQRRVHRRFIIVSEANHGDSEYCVFVN